MSNHGPTWRVQFQMMRAVVAVACLAALSPSVWAQSPTTPDPEPAGDADEDQDAGDGEAGQPATPPAPAPPAKATPQPRDKRTNKSKASGKSFVVDRVVAVVNDSVILHSELMRRVAPLTADLEQVSDPRERNRRQAKLKSQVLDEMVNEELIVQAAEESKLEVGAKEVQSALEEIKKQNNLDDNQLAEALRMQGYSMSGYRQDVRRQILRMRATNMLVRPRVTVTDDDVRARYDSLNRRSTAVKRIKLRHILISLPEKPNEAQVAQAKATAAEVIEKVRAGTDFARLAAEVSDDESTKYTGGDLGWIERGSIDTEWEVIVFGMNKDEVRGPITGPSGLHVFQVTDVERNTRKPFAEMKEQLRNEIFRREMERQTRLWLTELQDKAHIQIKL